MSRSTPSIGDFMNFMKGFRQNPRNAQRQVEDLLKSGRMTNEQFQQLQNEATQFQKMFGIK